MATSLTTRIQLTISATATDTAVVLPDGNSPSQSLSYGKTWAWASGTGVDTADRIYMKKDTVATGTPKTYDIAGGLTDILGNTITMAKVNAIIVVNNSVTAGEILTVGAGSNPLLNWVIATGDGVKAGPGGAVVCLDPSLAGYAVTGGTGDVLQISVAAGATVPIDVIIIGRSA
jgi:hypothetical protein